MTNKYDNVYVLNTSTVAGVKESKGPLKQYFTSCCDNEYMGEKTYEQAEIFLMTKSINLVTNKIKEKIDLFIAGDLLNQLMSSNINAKKFKFPYLGVYNACATSVESLIVASNFIDSKKCNNVLCSTSSHVCTAEKQFRYPNEYGALKPMYSTTTSTGGTSIILTNKKTKIKVAASTIGKVSDLGITDAFNMGAVMAHGAGNTIYTHLKNLGVKPSYYDIILTGDLGKYGKKILIDYLKKEYKLDISKNYNDCGVMLYNLEKQNVNAGGSGPACLPLVAYSYVIDKLKKKEFKRVLLCATGSLHSPTMINQKFSIPTIAHAISLEVL